MDNQLFYDADNDSFNLIAPELKRLFKSHFDIQTEIEKTEDGDTIDAEITAITKSNKYIIYTIEIKVRQKDKYTFTLFWNAENNNDGTIYSKGIFIKQKKIQSLLNKAKVNNSIPYYCMRFTDGIIALWHITDITPTGEVKAYYDLYNVNKGQKELQSNKTLSLKNAELIFDTKQDKIIQNLKQGLRYE